ncbi:MAG: bifunctional riboflavin kinase/FAD synthetase [Microthrixaceae bacterium]
MLILGDGVPTGGRATAPPWQAAAVTLGVYDGVHLGHRAVIAGLIETARRHDLTPVVVTFDPHPALVLRPDSAPRLLTDTEAKLELLAETGVAATYVMAFDRQRAAEEPEHFIKRVLVDELRVRQVMVGADFRFGHRRGGDLTMLEDAGRELGFATTGLDLVGVQGRPARVEEQVSSTAIRRALTEGRLEAANAMLGRPHELRGTVVRGDQRGRTWGFPTANVAVAPEMLRPEPGICAGHLVRADGTALPAAIYLGNRPTIYGDAGEVVLEVHVLDWEGDLYGERVAVRFTHHIRGDAAFDSFDELSAQIGRDCDEARRLLAAEETGKR